jgi:hypothetical protein
MRKASGAERRIGCFSGWSVEFEKAQHIVDQVWHLLYGLIGAYPWTSAFCECKTLYDVENDVRKMRIVNWIQLRIITDGREQIGKRWSFLDSGATEEEEDEKIKSCDLNFGDLRVTPRINSNAEV